MKKAARLAHTWLSKDPVFLDTETTGLDAGAQALEIGLVNARGDLIYEPRLKPTVSIDPAAAAVHGISEAMLADAPAWPDIAQQLQHHIGRRPLVIFNANFDTRILKQTAVAHNLPVSQAGLSWTGQAHSAIADAVMTARMVNDIAEYWYQLQREMGDN